MNEAEAIHRRADQRTESQAQRQSMTAPRSAIDLPEIDGSD
jgi:hypothetical protein